MRYTGERRRESPSQKESFRLSFPFCHLGVPQAVSLLPFFRLCNASERRRSLSLCCRYCASLPLFSCLPSFHGGECGKPHRQGGERERRERERGALESIFFFLHSLPKATMSVAAACDGRDGGGSRQLWIGGPGQPAAQACPSVRPSVAPAKV